MSSSVGYDYEWLGNVVIGVVVAVAMVTIFGPHLKDWWRKRK